jgi:hypothetical protein
MRKYHPHLEITRTNIERGEFNEYNTMDFTFWWFFHRHFGSADHCKQTPKEIDIYINQNFWIFLGTK